MSKVRIAVLGSKGGVGKTTLSHMFALGLAKFDYQIIHVTTDQKRQFLPDDKRPYMTKSGQTLEALGKMFKWIAHAKDDLDSALVIDGGGNRYELDSVIAKYADIIILPFKDSEEDIRVVMQDMQRIPKAYALPSAWPTNFFARIQAQSMLNKMEAAFPGRVLQPVPHIRASQSLLVGDFKTVETAVVSASKILVEQTMLKLNINVYKNKDRKF